MAATNFFCAGLQTKQLWRRWIPAFNFTKLRAYVSDKKLLRPLFLFFLTFSTYKVVPTRSGLAISLKTTVIAEISVRNLVSYTSYFWLKEHNLGHNDKFLCFSSSARIDFEGPGERKKKNTFAPSVFANIALLGPRRLVPRTPAPWSIFHVDVRRVWTKKLSLLLLSSNHSLRCPDFQYTVTDSKNQENIVPSYDTEKRTACVGIRAFMYILRALFFCFRTRA